MPARVAVERHGEQLLVRLGEARVVDAERARQQPEDLAVGARLAERSDRRLVEREVVVPPRPDDVEVLELRRRGEDHVRVARGVGHELLAHDREEVVAAQPREHALLIRRDRGGVRVPDDQRGDRRLHRRIRQRLADARHVERARRLASAGAAAPGAPRAARRTSPSGCTRGRRRGGATSRRAPGCRRSCGTRRVRRRGAGRPRRAGSATADPAPAPEPARGCRRPRRRSAAPAARRSRRRGARRARRSPARARGTIPRRRGRRRAARA